MLQGKKINLQGLRRIQLNFWQKFLFILGMLFIFLGTFLLIEPYLYFCRVKNEPIDKESLYCLINKARHKQGFRLLKSDSRLEKAAEFRALDIVAHNYFSHQSDSGMSKREAAIKSGYYYKLTGEILAKNFDNNKDIFNAWMKSASHSIVVLNPYYQDIGIAVLNSDRMPEGGIVVVGLFGSL